jgi:hypothetical protein
MRVRWQGLGLVGVLANGKWREGRDKWTSAN